MPHPLGPSSEKNSPSSIATESSDTAAACPKCLLTPSNAIATGRESLIAAESSGGPYRPRGGTRTMTAEACWRRVLRSRSPPRARAAPSPGGPGTLHYYNWIDYVNPDTYVAFTKATGIAVRRSYFASNEALLARLRRGALATTSPPPPATRSRRSQKKGSCAGSTGRSCPACVRRSTRSSSACRTTRTTAGRCRRTGARPASCTGRTRSRSGRRRGPSSSRCSRSTRAS